MSTRNFQAHSPSPVTPEQTDNISFESDSEMDFKTFAPKEEVDAFLNLLNGGRKRYQSLTNRTEGDRHSSGYPPDRMRTPEATDTKIDKKLTNRDTKIKREGAFYAQSPHNELAQATTRHNRSQRSASPESLLEDEDIVFVDPVNDLNLGESPHPK